MNIEPIVAGVPELSACREDGKADTVFASDEERIFVCGYVQTLEPIDIEIHWYYEDELVFQQFGEDADGHFYNFVQPNSVDDFPVGNYQIEALIAGTLANKVEFRVEEAQNE